jgi:SAM-dependent methyltransferase
MFFLRKSSLEPLPVVMSGVRMGERVLQIGIDDPSLVGAIAAKVGLSGHAAIAVADAHARASAQAAATKAGVLMDLQVTSLASLPFAESSFDVVVVHGVRGLLATFDESARIAMLREAHRTLRAGGRIVIIEGTAQGGIASLLRPRPRAEGYDASGGAVSALATAGFRAARVLGERERYRFSEGLKA